MQVSVIDRYKLGKASKSLMMDCFPQNSRAPSFDLGFKPEYYRIHRATLNLIDQIRYLLQRSGKVDLFQFDKGIESLFPIQIACFVLHIPDLHGDLS